MCRSYDRLRVQVELKREVYEWLKEISYRDNEIITVKMNQILELAYNQLKGGTNNGSK